MKRWRASNECDEQDRVEWFVYLLVLNSRGDLKSIAYSFVRELNAQKMDSARSAHANGNWSIRKAKHRSSFASRSMCICGLCVECKSKCDCTMSHIILCDARLEFRHFSTYESAIANSYEQCSSSITGIEHWTLCTKYDVNCIFGRHRSYCCRRLLLECISSLFSSHVIINKTDTDNETEYRVSSTMAKASSWRSEQWTLHAINAIAFLCSCRLNWIVYMKFAVNSRPDAEQ